MLRTITQSPYLNLLSGLVLLVTSGYEIAVTVDGAVIGARHGILIFSLIQILKTLPEVMHGLEQVQEVDEIIEERGRRLANQDAG